MMPGAWVRDDERMTLESSLTSPALRQWLEAQAAQHGLRWLLAHADDGVIWGEVDQAGRLTTSHEALASAAPHISPPLRAETLQQCRLFADTGELLLWRDGDTFKGRVLRDPADPDAWFDEHQLLWGDQAEQSLSGFTLLRESAQDGLRHAVPLPAAKLSHADPQERLARLVVRHYIEYDGETGEARVALSRLVRIEPVR